MKKSIFASAIIAMALSMGFTSCNKNGGDNEDDFMIWDMTALELLMVVQNAEGMNLLDPNTPNNFVGDTIIAEWIGEKYVADTLKYMQTRFNPGYMHASYMCGPKLIASQPSILALFVVTIFMTIPPLPYIGPIAVRM